MEAKVRAAIVLFVLALSSVEGAFGQEQEEKKKIGWSNVADLGLVITGGNSRTSTFIFDDKLTRSWKNATLQFKFSGLRTRTTDDRVAVVAGPDEFTVVEDVSADIDSERYQATGSYRRNISKNLFWLAGAGWLRDANAGIENLTGVFGGLGNTWWDRKDSLFLTDYAISYADREEEIEDPLLDGRFPAFRFSVDYMNEFGEHAEYDNDFVVLANLADLEDYQFDWTNSVTSNLTNLLALRVSLQLLYRNIPALEELDLLPVPPSEAPSLPIGTVPVRRKKLDTLFKVTLVVTL